jgi:hypothetical protein
LAEHYSNAKAVPDRSSFSLQEQVELGLDEYGEQKREGRILTLDINNGKTVCNEMSKVKIRRSGFCTSLKRYREAVKDLSQGSSAARPLVANRNAIHPEMGGRDGRSAQGVLVANWRLVGSKTKWCRRSPDASTTHSRVDPFFRGTRGFAGSTPG